MNKTSELVANKKAGFHYEILETFEAGIILTGTEVKSLKDHGGSLQEAYIKILGSDLWLSGCHIAPWKYGNINNHEPLRERKLLMHKNEIKRLKEASSEKGLTIIPLALYLKNGLVKVKIASAKGKTMGDKRGVIKERDEKRRIAKAMKQSNDF